MTLPGIAGFILTMGMGVDSNVLIFERIKEELEAQHGVRASINAGFNRVFWTLVDTHMAALISAAFLFQFGTGPIRGFAVTLVFGLMSNLFTSIFVSKTLFEFELSQRKVAEISSSHAYLSTTPTSTSCAGGGRRSRSSWVIILAGVFVIMDQGHSAGRGVRRRHRGHHAVRSGRQRPAGARRARPAVSGRRRGGAAVRRPRAAPGDGARAAAASRIRRVAEQDAGSDQGGARAGRHRQLHDRRD